MIIIIKKHSAFIISRNICKKVAEHRLRTSALEYKIYKHVYTYV